MHLSLHRDAYEPGVDMTLSVMIGYDEQRNPITDTFSISVDFFLKIIERLKKLPAGNPMNDSIGVDVELSKGLVHFRSTTLYVGPEGSSKEEIEGITLTLRELMMIPEEDLEKLTYINAVSEYRKQMFPDGETLTLDETRKRFPWISGRRHVVFTDESRVEGARITIAPSQTDKVFYFKRGVASKEELPRAITYAQKRHGLHDCYVMDGEGNEMACLSFDGSEMTKFGKKKYESGDWEKDWATMERDARFLLLRDFADAQRVVIYEFELSQAA
ncbi:MAG: hypothetical protein A2913_00700 [Parcubacteria group bacterium RIFCSPLOWO2_01_FULL_40_65]|nr:MAG: hypothetical protein A2734_01900 [Parcubacteria group bacterium RIFCSPHIGHO2_01_FULL_40_30]OHB21102.1 MAG: hypothetical protein A2913_00700 [Parcubacteria group bacterium RIFCSPLOWO2_01_FULL_40_65]OHB22699.1 MAG: hypothetical protein A3I22_02215 [Parcubacteria group bacterium RIFCSPLOWO2_02_FULL_40_12]OHB24207.1 MAG: hypothetical protein A3F96_01800 [Parcubacteria group bacterium RIFCSPLOWO2_12_FULL_40_10]